MIRKFSLANAMFSTNFSLAKGIRSKTGAAHPRQKIFGVPPRGVQPTYQLTPVIDFSEYTRPGNNRIMN